MQIISIEGHVAQCEAMGVRRSVSLFLLQDLQLSVEDYVMVHVGYAIQKIGDREAQSAWAAYDELQRCTQNSIASENA
jgi:hydrogenase expression/formation protein HypC